MISATSHYQYRSVLKNFNTFNLSFVFSNKFDISFCEWIINQKNLNKSLFKGCFLLCYPPISSKSAFFEFKLRFLVWGFCVGNWKKSKSEVFVFWDVWFVVWFEGLLLPSCFHKSSLEILPSACCCCGFDDWWEKLKKSMLFELVDWVLGTEVWRFCCGVMRIPSFPVLLTCGGWFWNWLAGLLIGLLLAIGFFASGLLFCTLACSLMSYSRGMSPSKSTTFLSNFSISFSCCSLSAFNCFASA